MVLLKHGNFEFKNILSGGYNILENEPDVITEKTMANGSIRRNYRNMPKTNIKIKFGQLNKALYVEYMSHFEANEDEYTYFSPAKQTMLTKKFFVKRPEISMIYEDDIEQLYEEFEVELSQYEEVDK